MSLDILALLAVGGIVAICAASILTSLLVEMMDDED